MKQLNIPFKIGEEYEEHEFELDWVKSIIVDNLCYEVYRFTGKHNESIFNFKVHETLLAYNCDILAIIFYFINKDFPNNILSEIQKKSSYTSRLIVKMVKLKENITILIISEKKINLTLDILINLGRI
jgi:hypothetical protein